MNEATAADFRRLVEVVERLRGPAGCPWDLAQTPASLRPYLLEEAHEVVEAIDAGDPDALREELGDLLFLVLLLAEMARQAGWFDLGGVCRGIADKMVRRHPHVFGARAAAPAGPEAASHAAWEARKAEERGHRGSALDGIPAALPALLAAHRAGEKAARTGFDWREPAGARAKVDEELAELDEALAARDAEAVEHELGDVLHALAQLGRLVGIPAEDALRVANRRFARRFRSLEEAARRRGANLHALDEATLEALWRNGG